MVKVLRPLRSKNLLVMCASMTIQNQMRRGFTLLPSNSGGNCGVMFRRDVGLGGGYVTYAECVYGCNSASAWFLRCPRRLRRRGLLSQVLVVMLVKLDRGDCRCGSSVGI